MTGRERPSDIQAIAQSLEITRDLITDMRTEMQENTRMTVGVDRTVALMQSKMDAVVDKLDRISTVVMTGSDPLTSKVYLLEKTCATVEVQVKEAMGKVEAVQTRLTTMEGKGLGAHNFWIYLLGAISFIGAIVALWKR